MIHGWYVEYEELKNFRGETVKKNYLDINGNVQVFYSLESAERFVDGKKNFSFAPKGELGSVLSWRIYKDGKQVETIFA